MQLTISALQSGYVLTHFNGVVSAFSGHGSYALPVPPHAVKRATDATVAIALTSEHGLLMYLSLTIAFLRHYPGVVPSCSLIRLDVADSTGVPRCDFGMSGSS